MVADSAVCFGLPDLPLLEGGLGGGTIKPE